MSAVKRGLLLILGLIMTAAFLSGAEHLLIQARLFRAVWPEGRPLLERVEILTLASRPELAALIKAAAGTERELTAAALDALIGIYDLPGIENLFLQRNWWDGKELHDVFWDGTVPRKNLMTKPRPFLQDGIVVGRMESFQILFSPMETSPGKYSLGLSIAKSQFHGETALPGEMEKLIEQSLSLEMGAPVIVLAPYKTDVYFLLLHLKMADPAAVKAESAKIEPPKRIYTSAEPKAILQNPPVYPKELRRRQIGGQVGLVIWTDAKGNVEKVLVEKPLYPYLDYEIVQASRKWTFEPVLYEGKPIPAMFRHAYSFYPSVAVAEKENVEPPPADSNDPSKDALPGLLLRAGEYCGKLAAACMDFVCEETIKETHFNLLDNIKWMAIAVRARANRTPEGDFVQVPENNPGMSMKYFGASFQAPDKVMDPGPFKEPDSITRYQYMDPQLTIRNDFLCDYQIVKKAGTAEERRVVLKERGRKPAAQKNLLDETRFSGLGSLFAPLRVLAQDRQPLFNFKIIDRDSVSGVKAFVLEATPKSLDEDGLESARFWLDEKSAQILKCEISGIPIDGYEDVLRDCAILNVVPEFKSTYEYKTESGGVRLPHRSRIHVAYPNFDRRGKVEKIDMTLAYAKFRFFTVETDHRVIK